MAVVELTRPSVDRELQTLPIRSSDDVVRVRQAVRTAAVGLGFSLVDQTKLVTAASELARNTIDYGKGGDCELEVLRAGDRHGLRVAFRDNGPGIPDIEQALRDGFTTGHGLGMGLGGARRLVDEFEIESAPSQGTRVRLVKWSRQADRGVRV
jgi:serine/threonine-protein kinase RsbT